MTVEPLENGVYLSFGGNGLYYSIDDSDWVSLPMYTNTPSINVGQTIKIKGLNIKTNPAMAYFSINGRCKLSGTIMSIIYGDKPYEEKLPLAACFKGAFYLCTSLVEVAPDFLPATTLTESCYEYMFYGCTGLTTAPELPATTLEDSCYSRMFEGCKSLTSAPTLPATTLKSSCYYNMFYGCTGLTTAPELPATTLEDSCYSRMFEGCKSLTSAPTLPATTLADRCYEYMFSDCSNINYIKMLATDISGHYCLFRWVDGVASTGTFVKNKLMISLPVATSSNYYEGIPSGWTVINNG